MECLCLQEDQGYFWCDWRLACSSIFVKGSAISPVTIEDKETSKHMFQVMRLKEEDQVTLVFDDGIKRLARVVNVEARRLELVEELADNVELPVQVTIASGFPKGDKLEFITQKVTELGASQIWAFPADWSVAKWDGKKLGKKVEETGKNCPWSSRTK